MVKERSGAGNDADELSKEKVCNANLFMDKINERENETRQQKRENEW